MNTLAIVQAQLDGAASILGDAPTRPTLADIAWDVTDGDCAPTREGWGTLSYIITLGGMFSVITAAVTILASK